MNLSSSLSISVARCEHVSRDVSSVASLPDRVERFWNFGACARGVIRKGNDAGQERAIWEDIKGALNGILASSYRIPLFERRATWHSCFMEFVLKLEILDKL